MYYKNKMLLLIILINKLPLCFNIKHIIVQIKTMHFVPAFHLYSQYFTLVTAATVQSTEKNPVTRQ